MLQVSFPINGDYKNTFTIKDGQVLTKEETKWRPRIDVNVLAWQLWPSVIALYDETVGYLHLLAHRDGDHGRLIYEDVRYQGPSPPKGSGPHSYRFFLFANLDPKSFEQIVTSGIKLYTKERRPFNLVRFAQENKLVPIGHLSFIVEQK